MPYQLPPTAPLWQRVLDHPLIAYPLGFFIALAAPMVGGYFLLLAWTTLLGWLDLPGWGRWEWLIQ